jgi:hypothetical protein
MINHETIKPYAFKNITNQAFSVRKLACFSGNERASSVMRVIERKMSVQHFGVF